MVVDKFLSNTFQKLMPFSEIILGFITGVAIAFFVDKQAGLIVASVGLIVYTARIIIIQWCHQELGDFSKMYVTHKIYELDKEINKNEDKDFINEATKAQESLINKLHDLSIGRLKFHNNYDHLNALKKEVTKTKILRTTSIIDPFEWDIGGEFEKYFETQKKAIKEKKLKVIRIFLLYENEMENAEKILRMHAENDIEVRIINRESCKTNRCIAIFDDRVAFYGTLGENNKITKGCKTINKNDIEKLTSKFADLLIQSRLYKPNSSKTDSSVPE